MPHPGWAPLAPDTPAPPKPGVIPLAPLSLGDCFGALAGLVRGYWRPLLVLGATIYGIAYTLTYTASTAAVLSLGSDDPFIDLDQGLSGALIVSVTLLLLLAMALHFTADAMAGALAPAVLREAVLGRPAPTADIRRQAVRRTPALLGATALTTLACAAPVVAVLWLTLMSGPMTLLLLLLVLPFLVWFWTRCSLAPAVVVLEGAGPMTALRRSFRLVRGSWWRVFGIQLLMGAIGLATATVLVMPFELLGSAAPSAAGDGVEFTLGLLLLLPTIAGALVTTLLSRLTVALLYTDQRIRREGLAPALAEAAYSPR
ncbi:hypothetical protein H9Y04_05105 [Streptomyces sp. TRM66268-LWL]|uniref:DUF7847 domain-containing protein n=1 Tax=Streptomyces polyasparticus TaxID=2767826 RepID=A0ABR7S8Y5_9ACTN|nr:hypothetical protein [Streptomyces polyasparticus]MBC9711946.1 hypothetical protein [Streptomyces polyasparticus]